MSIRQEILNELLSLYDEKGPNNYAIANSLKCFNKCNGKNEKEKYVTAMNQLLSEKLILGIENSGDKTPLVAINSKK